MAEEPVLPELDVIDTDIFKADAMTVFVGYDAEVQLACRERQLLSALTRMAEQGKELTAKDAKYAAYREEAVTEYARYEGRIAEQNAKLEGCIFLYECSKCAWIANEEHLGQTCRACHVGTCIRLVISAQTEKHNVYFSNVYRQQSERADTAEALVTDLRAQVAKAREDALREAAKVANDYYADPGYHPFLTTASQVISGSILALALLTPENGGGAK